MSLLHDAKMPSLKDKLREQAEEAEKEFEKKEKKEEKEKLIIKKSSKKN